MKYILIIYILSTQTSERIPGWYDTKADCEAAGKEVATQDIRYTCPSMPY